MLNQLYYLNKLRKHLGFKDALNAFLALRIKNTGQIKVAFIKHPFRIRLNNKADSATFNEVILRQEYLLKLPFTPKTIIDGGANIGLTSIYLASRFPQAEIVSIEPDSENFKLLSDNTSRYPNITPIQSAIWHTSTYLRVYDTGLGANSYRVEESAAEEQGAFKAMGISDIIKQKGWDTIDVLKLDIEGSEKQVFADGYEEWLPKTKVLMVETHDRFIKGTSRSVFKTMALYNFSCLLKGFNLLFINDDLVEQSK